MIDWASDTADYAIVALENARTGGTEVVDGAPAFRADQFIGMRSEREVERYLDAIDAFLPAVNTIRMPVNAKSLHPDVPGSAVVEAALIRAAQRGQGIILVYTDPIFLGDRTRPYDPGYYDNNVSPLDGRPIELDGPVASGKDRSRILDWGPQSPSHDPVDELTAGWGFIHDWLDRHPEVRVQVRGFELVNEPGRVYRDHGDAVEMHAYAAAMAHVHAAHAGRWNAGPGRAGAPLPARVLVDVAGSGSGRVGALDSVPPGAAESGLDLLRRSIGPALVWSVHTFTDTSLAEFTAPDSFTGLAKLAGDDILITETQFDGDFQLLQSRTNDLAALAATYGVSFAAESPTAADFYDAQGRAILAPWMGWELLDPLMGSRNYFGAREKPWYGQHGIGSGYWSPVGFDASMLVGYSGKNVEVSRDIIAFAHAMWTAGMSPDAASAAQARAGAARCRGADLCVSEAAPKVEDRPQLPPMIAIGSHGAEAILGVDSPRSEGGVRHFRQGGRETRAGQARMDDTQASNGDIVLALDGADSVDLRGGDDYAFGGTGADRLDGGTGHDVLLGDDGDDVLDGGTGGDVVEGGTGNDRLDGGEGPDLLVGNAGDDVMIGGEGADYFYLDAAGDGQDTIVGFEWGVDRLVIGNAQDFVGKRSVTFVDTDAPRDRFDYGAGAQVTFAPAP